MHRKRIGGGKQAVVALALVLGLTGLTAPPAYAAATDPGNGGPGIGNPCFDVSALNDLVVQLVVAKGFGLISQEEFVAAVLFIVISCGPLF